MIKCQEEMKDGLGFLSVLDSGSSLPVCLALGFFNLKRSVAHFFPPKKTVLQPYIESSAATYFNLQRALCLGRKALFFKKWRVLQKSHVGQLRHILTKTRSQNKLNFHLSDLISL